MRRCEAASRLELSLISLLATASLSNAFALPAVGSKSLLRRQKQEDIIPSAVSIAPSQNWDGIDGPWSSFPLQVGTGDAGGLQDVRVMMSTAATAIWTIGAEGCPPGYPDNCADSRGYLFLRNQSLTWTENSLYQTGLEINLGMDSSGYQGYDVATLGWQGSTTVTDDHSIIWNLADSNYWLGVFGLNPRPTNFSTFSNPQMGFMESIFQRKAIPSLSYGYTAGNKYRFDNVYGSLTLGGYDENRFILNNVSFEFYEDISRDLSVYLHSITSDDTTPTNLLPDGSISIFIDSTIPELWLPESACAAFEDAFGLVYNENSERYLVTDERRQQLLDQNAHVTLTIGPSQSGGETVDITFPYQAFDLQVNYPIVTETSYYFPLRRAANDTQYTLGRTFLQEAYLIADYEHQNFTVSACDWNEERLKAQQLVRIVSPNWSTADPEGEPFFSTAEIAGIGVGSIGVIAILSFALFVLRRKRNQEKRRLEEAAAEAEKASNAASSSNSSGPYYTYPMGGELGGGDIVEMPHGQNFSPAEMDGPYKADPNQYGYNEMAGGEYFVSGKYYRFSATEMDGNTPIYEMPGSSEGSDPSDSTPERGPAVPPK